MASKSSVSPRLYLTAESAHVLKEYWRSEGWTVAGMARRLGVSRTFMYHWLTGKVPVPEHIISEIPRALVAEFINMWVAKMANLMVDKYLGNRR